jgi:hypothetical protein
MKCKQIWQPNFVDSKSIKKGYVWRCFCCSRVRKTTPKEMK